MLEIDGLAAAYGRGVLQQQVLFDVSLEIEEGEVLGLLGRNGMGKTTTLRALFNLTRRLKGRIRFLGQDLARLPAHRVASLGIGLVPEGRQIFPSLSVEENLVATARPGDTAVWTLDAVYALFPRLKERRRQGGGRLSGGEQQMLAIGRALLTNPRLLVLDEATEGLAPSIRGEIWQVLRRLKAEGQAILLIDPNLERVLKLADKNVILENGRSVWSGPAAALARDPAIARRHLAV